jgi:hypothetical protein
LPGRSSKTALTGRVTHLEGPGNQTASDVAAASRHEPGSAGAVSTVNRRNASAKSLSSLWYEWFSDLSAYETMNRRRYHEAKLAIAFMRMFLPDGYDVTGSSNDSKSRILTAGRDAEVNVLVFLRSGNSRAKSCGTIVKVLKRMHAEGKLNDLITRYQSLKEKGAIKDDSPVRATHDLQPSAP